MDVYEHYIRTDSNGIVVKGFTTGFEQPQQGDLLLSGKDERHFDIPLTNERGQYRYKIENGAMVERSQADLDGEWASRPAPPPSPDDRIRALEDALLLMMLGG